MSLQCLFRSKSSIVRISLSGAGSDAEILGNMAFVLQNMNLPNSRGKWGRYPKVMGPSTCLICVVLTVGLIDSTKQA